ncbi:hypothetical protein A6R68_16690 [Neotoma lepida]|uniref:Uncharacterized protein n=1 Tax=Neotoma lepida TaxID=56216 RepID=A0A1A6HF48_NEOLE|nr:hypothetical protein A6R68_16690 [Neotoma lepida]
MSCAEGTWQGRSQRVYKAEGNDERRSARSACSAASSPSSSKRCSAVGLDWPGAQVSKTMAS